MRTTYEAHIDRKSDEYSIQFESGNYEYFKMVEKACRKVINKKDKAVMKAYRVMECEDGYCIAVVFAESAGKAKSYALNYIFDGVNYCDLIANRVPLIDKYYQKNKKEMDWMNPNDRLILVKELGIHCAFDTVDIPDCQKCRAKNYCDVYEEYSELLKEVIK